jgi:hypothetical protein
MGIVPCAVPYPVRHAPAKKRQMENGRQWDWCPDAAGHGALEGRDQSSERTPQRQRASIPPGNPPETMTGERTSSRRSTMPT